jgi:hypothetical protein
MFALAIDTFSPSQVLKNEGFEWDKKKEIKGNLGLQ